MSDILTISAHLYFKELAKHFNQFFDWGETIFFSLLTINITFCALWYAFENESFHVSIAEFIRKLFVILFFYTLMLFHGWLISLIKTAQFMGNSLTNMPTDPSSLISQGIGIANKIIYPVHASGLLVMGFGGFVILITYLVVLFSFISVALQLTVTLIVTTGLIVISPFCLAFSALARTEKIAYNILQIILANCFKLIGIYFVIAVGSQTISYLSGIIPEQVNNFDIYAWLLSVVLLFWMLTKNLPEQLAKLVSDLAQETQNYETGSILMSSVEYFRLAASAGDSGLKATLVSAKEFSKIGNSVYSRGSDFFSKEFHSVEISKNGAANNKNEVSNNVNKNLSSHLKEIKDRVNHVSNGSLKRFSKNMNKRNKNNYVYFRKNKKRSKY